MVVYSAESGREKRGRGRRSTYCVDAISHQKGQPPTIALESSKVVIEKRLISSFYIKYCTPGFLP